MYKPKQKKKQWKLEKIEIHVVTNVLEVLYVEMLITMFDNNKRFGVRNIWLDLNGHDHYFGQKLFFLI